MNSADAHRVAILVPSISGGGAEFVAKEWATWLADHGIEVDVLTTDRSGSDIDSSRTGFRIRFVAGSGFVERVRNLRRLALENPYDCVISLMPYWNLMALTLKLSGRTRAIKVLVSSRNSESSLSRALGVKFRLLTFVARRSYQFADGLIAISHPVAAEAIATYGIDPDRVFVVPNPATAKFDRDSHDYQDSDLLPDSVVRIVVPARIVEQKRPWLAVEVAKILSQHHPVELHFFGSGNLSTSISDLCSKSNINFTMHGWVESWYRDAPRNSIVLLPSLAEGFGNVLVEACAAGLPAVASSRALGVADAIVPGITGVLIAGDSAEEYAEGVLQATECDPSVASSWLARFSAESSGLALSGVLRSVLPGRFEGAFGRVLTAD